jgi:hypothetical protein
MLASALYLGGGSVYRHVALGRRGSEALPHREAWISEKDAELAQKLSQLQPFIAVFL